MRDVYLAVLLTTAAVVFLFRFQNLEALIVQFLSASLTLPAAAAVVVAAGRDVLGMLTGGVVPSRLRSWGRGATTNPRFAADVEPAL